jgi:hypothetical protein
MIVCDKLSSWLTPLDQYVTSGQTKVRPRDCLVKS